MICDSSKKRQIKMNVEDLMQTVAIVLTILTLLKIDISEMMSTSWKELIFLAFVFITVLYLPFPYGIILQVICKGMELLVGHSCKTRSRPENEKPGNEKLNSSALSFYRSQNVFGWSKCFVLFRSKIYLHIVAVTNILVVTKK